MKKEKDTKTKTRQPSQLEKLILGQSVNELPRVIPGICLTVVLVILAIWLTRLLNASLGFEGLISYILIVIILGILLRNFISIPPVFTFGISFSVKKLLRLGIIMMGIRLSIFDVLKIGAWGIPIVIVCIIGALVTTVYFCRLLKIPERLATLIAAGTSICGVSAIVATAPGIEARDEEVTYAVANITVFGIIAMVVYPLIMHYLFNANTTMIGLYLGTSIHETAQVAASGMIYDQTFNPTVFPTALDVATVTKLVRNIMMAIVIPVLTFIYSRRNAGVQDESERGLRKALKLFPIFIIGFLIMAIIRSVGDAGIQGSGLAYGLLDAGTWKSVCSGIKEWSGYVLATAMAGVGLSTSFKTMKGLGIKPFYAGLFAAVVVGVISFIMVSIMGGNVNV